MLSVCIRQGVETEVAADFGNDVGDPAGGEVILGVVRVQPFRALGPQILRLMALMILAPMIAVRVVAVECIFYIAADAVTGGVGVLSWGRRG